MTPTCATCVHWSAWGFRGPPGRPVVGACALGGPTPEDGCSDCHASESCQRHERKVAPCATCRWWKPERVPTDTDEGFGICHVDPERVREEDYGTWPGTLGGDGCERHEPKEEK